jgi:hypothetical protein
VCVRLSACASLRRAERIFIQFDIGGDLL